MCLSCRPVGLHSKCFAHISKQCCNLLLHLLSVKHYGFYTEEHFCERITICVIERFFLSVVFRGCRKTIISIAVSLSTYPSPSKVTKCALRTSVKTIFGLLRKTKNKKRNNKHPLYRFTYLLQSVICVISLFNLLLEKYIFIENLCIYNCVLNSVLL